MNNISSKFQLPPKKGIYDNIGEIIKLAREWICIIIILFALNAFSLNLGYISPIFSRLLGLLSLLGLLIFYSPVYSNISKNKDPILGIILILFSLVLPFLSLKPEYWVICLPIFIYGFDLLLKSKGVHENILPALSLCSLIYAIFYICYINIPSLWLGIKSLSESFSNIIGRVVGVQLIIGPSINGTFILFTFILCTFAFIILSDKRKRLKIFILAIVGLILIDAIFIAAHAKILATGEMAMDDLYIAFLMFAIAFIFVIQAFKIKPVSAGSMAFRKIDGAAVIIIFFALILVSIFPYIGDGSVGKVVIYERNCEMGFDLPQFPQGNESFQPYSSFSVRGMGLYLEKIGYKVEDLNRTNPQTLKDALKDADVLMLINLNKSFSSDDLESIWDFIKKGGNLIAFGDHTSMFSSDEDFKSGKDYLNEVLSPTGIRINQDTADYVSNHWTYANTFLPHYVSKDLGFEITTSSVGASLNLSRNARPVIIGRYSFSDKPNATVPGHLGDRTYDSNEKIGDLVVVASDTYGKGNVLVFGDTSYIFSSEVPFRYKLVRDSIVWLMSHESESLVFLPWISLIILGILAIGYLFHGQSKDNMTLLNAIIAIAIALSLVISGSINNSLIQVQESREKDIAWIDHSHLNQFNLNNYEDDSIDGLITNMYRNNYMPLVLEEKDDFSEILNGGMLVIIAPNGRYTPEEVAILDKFVKNGGLLVITAGYGSKGPLDPLLKSFNLSIGSVPLGSAPWIVETHNAGESGSVTPENLKKYWHKPKFMEAYPVMATGKYDPITWLNYRGVTYNLTIAKKIGDGAVVLIGDSRFLLNENLEYASDLPGKENLEQYQLQWLGNIELLREIVSKYKGVRI
ncbi:MAG: DUF4350 domain-containing protein [Methanotrichaceae archaeon]